LIKVRKGGEALQKTTMGDRVTGSKVRKPIKTGKRSREKKTPEGGKLDKAGIEITPGWQQWHGFDRKIKDAEKGEGGVGTLKSHPRKSQTGGKGNGKESEGGRPSGNRRREMVRNKASPFNMGVSGKRAR